MSSTSSCMGLNMKCPFHAFSIGVLVSFSCYQLLKFSMKKIANEEKNIERFDVDNRFSDAIRYGDLVFLTGQVNSDSATTIEEQTRSALANVDLALAKAGTNKSRIVDITIYLCDIKKDYDGMNAVYDTWIEKGKPPCRACVQATLAADKYRVEFKVIAAR